MDFCGHQRVLVTGGAGFRGRRVVARLREAGVIRLPRRRAGDVTKFAPEPFRGEDLRNGYTDETNAFRVTV